MLLLAVAISLIFLILALTVVFVFLKLLTHYRLGRAEEEEEKQNNGPEFSGIRKNSSFARLIEKSFANQTVTLAKMVEDTETFVYQCVYCNVIMVEVRGDWDCSHCGGDMRLTDTNQEQEESLD